MARTCSLKRLGLVWIEVASLVYLVACSSGQTSAESPDGAGALDARATQCLADAATLIAVPADAPARVEVRHIVVRHAALKDPKGAPRNKPAACLRALDALQALQSGDVDWPTAVAEYSDSKDDDLGRVSSDELDPAFAGAAFSLEVDQLSYVVETPRGFHVILRER